MESWSFRGLLSFQLEAEPSSSDDNNDSGDETEDDNSRLTSYF